jgi:hypothetical protein
VREYGCAPDGSEWVDEIKITNDYRKSSLGFRYKHMKILITTHFRHLFCNQNNNPADFTHIHAFNVVRVSLLGV